MFDDKKREEYLALVHGMQTGVEYQKEFDSKETNPKHLRTGVNSALVETGVLAELLIKAGVFSAAEYQDALIKGMKKEVERYQNAIQDNLEARTGNRPNIQLM